MSSLDLQPPTEYWLVWLFQTRCRRLSTGWAGFWSTESGASARLWPLRHGSASISKRSVSVWKFLCEVMVLQFTSHKMGWRHFSLRLDWKQLRIWWVGDGSWTEGMTMYRVWIQCKYRKPLVSSADREAPDPHMIWALWNFLKNSIHKWCLVTVGMFKDWYLNLERKNCFLSRF